MKKFRVALIGQGRSGRDIHGQFFLSENNTQFTVVAVVDAIPERRERAQKEFGCDVYADYHELFGRTDIDLVVNSTFSYLHAPISIDLLRHGFNVVCEKPFAKNYEEACGVVNAAKETGKMLNVFQQSRFAPYFEEVCRLVSSGRFGRVVQYSIRYSGFARRWDWQTSLAWGGGNLRNSGPHPLDQALALLDFDENVQVFSRLDKVNSFGDAEDFAKVILSAPGKPLIDIEISACNCFEPYVFTVSCERGTICATHTKITYKVFDPATAPEQKLILGALEDAEGKPAYCSEKLDWIEETRDIPGSVFTVAVEKYYDMIYRYLTEGRPMEIDPSQVLLQMKVIDLVRAQNPLAMM